MMWFMIEFLFFTNIILAVLPQVTIAAKKSWSLFAYSVLTSCLLLLLMSKISFMDLLSFVGSNITFRFSFVFMLDNLTVIFCFLICLIAVICQMLTWHDPNYSNANFLILLWVLSFTLFHTFTSLNLLSFFVFFEMSLFPMILVILLWGSSQRKVHAMFLFLFYTAVGSLFLLFGLLYIYSFTNTLFLPCLSYLSLDFVHQFIVWTCFLIGFMVKIPMVPFHTWLPEAHVEAPTIGSMILAGLLLKVGTFGALSFMFPFLNLMNHNMQPVIFILCLVSMYHASLMALRQIDLKKLIAYSSIAHMGFVVLGLFSFTMYGILGSIFIMFSHGLVASALFLMIGVLYDRYKSRLVFDYSGLASVMPMFTFFFFFFILCNLSFPGTSNFVGEILVLFGVAEMSYTVAFFATFSIMLTSSYSIWAFNSVGFGKLGSNLIGFSDLNKNEFFLASLLAFLTLLFGFQPSFFVAGIDYLPFLLMSN